MIGTPIQPVRTIIRAIPNWAGAPEQFFDVTDLPWKESSEFSKELQEQGFFLQTIMPVDPMPVFVAAEIRKRIAAEQESKK